MKNVEVSRATMGRIPTYLKYLKDTKHKTENISAPAIAKALGMGEVQVRKDLGSVSGAGRPKTGYNVPKLITTLEEFLSVGKTQKVVLVGAGRLGRALLDYGGFADYGLEISAAFDTSVTGEEISDTGKPIYGMDAFADFCSDNDVKIGIITVPRNAAQDVCNTLVQNGIKAVWCFAACTLEVPADVTVQYENMALSLAYLNKKVREHNT